MQTIKKFYGNLSIQEYRKLLNNERILMVVDKPMTKVLPELYEENNEIPNIFQDILHSSNDTWRLWPRARSICCSKCYCYFLNK